ncbi:MAG: DUF2240 family protein, partial [Candidatus Hermodarchaeota archaeon]
MKSEIYINKIIEDTGLQRKEIQKLVEEKKKELKGLISEEGALFIIAKELGVDIKEETKSIMEDIEIKIVDISPNMKNITLVGRIKEIYDAFAFNRDDGKTGKVGSFLLNDDTGDIRIVLWDDQADIIESQNFDINELIKIINGFAREGKDKNTEIHIGRLGKVIISPNDIDYKKYPKTKSKIIQIKDINDQLLSISVEGTVINIFPLKEFERKEGKKGKVRALNLADSTGSIRVSFWNDGTDKLKDVKFNDYVQITNLKPRRSNLDPNKIDLNANNYSKVIQKTLDNKKVQKEVDQIELLQTMQTIVSFKGIITSIDNLKKITSKTGEELSIYLPNLTNKAQDVLKNLFKVYMEINSEFKFENFYKWIKESNEEDKNQVIWASNSNSSFEIKASKPTAQNLVRELSNFQAAGIFDMVSELNIRDILNKKVVFFYLPRIRGYEQLRTILLFSLISKIIHYKTQAANKDKLEDFLKKQSVVIIDEAHELIPYKYG